MSGENLDILLIADNINIRKALRERLESCGFNVCESCEATDALQIIADGFEPHIVITDMLADEATRFTAAMRMLWEGPVNVVALDDMAELVGAEEGHAGAPDHTMIENVILGLARAG